MKRSVVFAPVCVILFTISLHDVAALGKVSKILNEILTGKSWEEVRK